MASEKWSGVAAATPMKANLKMDNTTERVNSVGVAIMPLRALAQPRCITKASSSVARCTASEFFITLMGSLRAISSLVSLKARL
jgi:hypothetical protein